MSNLVPKFRENNTSEVETHTVASEIKDFYSVAELYEMNVTELPMLIEPIFLKSGIAIFSGSSDTGKSTLLRQLGVAIVRGDDDFLGWKINAEHNKVIYVSTEDDKIAIAHLLRKSLGEGFESSILEDFQYIFETDTLIEKLEQSLKEKPADVIIIDAFTDLFGGDLNQANHVRKFLNGYFKLANDYNCLFIFLHHTGKRTEQFAPSKNNLIGSQGIEGKARQVIELRRDPHDNSFRHLCIVKGNYLPDEMKSSSYKLRFNEDLTFSMTGERVDFENLAIKPKSKAEFDELLTDRLVPLIEEGITYERAVEIMKSEGFKISVGKANKLYKKAKED